MRRALPCARGVDAEKSVIGTTPSLTSKVKRAVFGSPTYSETFLMIAENFAAGMCVRPSSSTSQSCTKISVHDSGFAPQSSASNRPLFTSVTW